MIFPYSFPVIYIDELVLEKPLIKHFKDIFEIFGNEEVVMYDIFPIMTDCEQAKSYIERYAKEFAEREEITWIIHDRSSEESVGVCCLGDFDFDSERCEIGYDIKRRFWNQGYATKAIKAVTEYAFMKIGINRIEAFISPENKASIRVLEKCGYSYEGLLRQRDLIKGKLEDAYVMALLKDEYKKSLLR